MEIEIRPLDGIYWADNAICIGDSKREVERILGKAESETDEYWYFDMELVISFDLNDKVRYISDSQGEENPLWDASKIQVGDTRQEVEAMLGEPETRYHRQYFMDTELAVDYDKEGKTEYIEFLAGMDGMLRPIIYGESAFTMKAERLYALLEDKNNGEVDGEDQGYSYAFKTISVGIYREAIPSSIEEMREELLAEGNDPNEDEEIKFLEKEAGHWKAIGIGGLGYYNK